MQVESSEPEMTTITEKGQVVIPKRVRSRLGIKPRNRFLVYGEGDTVVLKKLELPNVKKEWKKLKSIVDKRIEKLGEVDDDEVNELVQKYRHRGKR